MILGSPWQVKVVLPRDAHLSTCPSIRALDEGVSSPFQHLVVQGADGWRVAVGICVYRCGVVHVSFIDPTCSLLSFLGSRVINPTIVCFQEQRLLWGSRYTSMRSFMQFYVNFRPRWLWHTWRNRTAQSVFEWAICEEDFACYPVAVPWSHSMVDNDRRWDTFHARCGFLGKDVFVAASADWWNLLLDAHAAPFAAPLQHFVNASCSDCEPSWFSI